MGSESGFGLGLGETPPAIHIFEWLVSVLVSIKKLAVEAWEFFWNLKEILRWQMCVPCFLNFLESSFRTTQRLFITPCLLPLTEKMRYSWDVFVVT